VYLHTEKTHQMCQKTETDVSWHHFFWQIISISVIFFFTFWHVYNFLLKSFEDKLWVNKSFLYVFPFQIKNRNKIWIRNSFESSVYLEESLIARITSLIFLNFYNTWLINHLIVLTKIIWILSAQFWREFEELVAHGEGNIFCEKLSKFDKLININVKFHFFMTKVLVPLIIITSRYFEMRLQKVWKMMLLASSVSKLINENSIYLKQLVSILDSK